MDTPLMFAVLVLIAVLGPAGSTRPRSPLERWLLLPYTELS